MKNIKNKWFVVFTALYAIWIACNSADYSPQDDNCFLGIYEYANLWRGMDPSEFTQGRFNILHGLDLYLLKHFADFFGIQNPVPLFYGFIALVFFASMILLIRIIEKITTAWWIFVILATILFNEAFTSIYFRLLYQERYVFISFLIFILFIFRIEKGEKVAYWKIVTVSMFAMFIKEIPFLSFGVFGLAYLFYKYKKRTLSQYHKKLGIILIASSIFYLLLYFAIVFPQIVARYGTNSMGYFESVVRSVWLWLWINPLLFMVFLPLMAYRMYRIVFKRMDVITLYDCFGLAGSIYCCAFFVLKMMSTHYLTSVYAWAIPTVLYFYFKEKYYKKLLFFLAGIGFAVISITNTRLGTNDIEFQRYTNKNFASVVAMMDSMSTHQDTARYGRIKFLVRGGADRNVGTVVPSFLYFMITRDTSFSSKVMQAMKDSSFKFDIKPRFDLLSEEKACERDGTVDLPEKTNFGFMDADTVSLAGVGDYIVITPYAISHFQDSLPQGARLIRKWTAPRPRAPLGLQELTEKIICKLQIIGQKKEKYRPLHAEYRLYQIQ